MVPPSQWYFISTLLLGHSVPLEFFQFIFRREKLKRNIPTAEEITERLKGANPNHKTSEVSRDELQYSSEESGTNEVMRRFLGEPQSP